MLGAGMARDEPLELLSMNIYVSRPNTPTTAVEKKKKTVVPEKKNKSRRGTRLALPRRNLQNLIRCIIPV